jgi:hypothetical protein
MVQEVVDTVATVAACIQAFSSIIIPAARNQFMPS